MKDILQNNKFTFKKTKKKLLKQDKTDRKIVATIYIEKVSGTTIYLYGKGKRR